jgi:MFS transporter, DHA1 family, multidrug resistance protein
MKSQFLKNAIILGLLAAIGPFAIDMYVPALRAISADLGASTAATQMTLMVFFVSFGVCQIVYGPVSDMVGRRGPLFVGLILFIAGAIGCGFAPTIEWLIAFRFVQGVGAAACMVIVRAVIRDLHTGIQATRLMSLVMLVFSVSPILAPVTGSGLIVLFGWRAVFAAVSVAALFGLVLIAIFLPETRPAADRVRSGFGSVLSGYGKLLTDGRFLGVTFIGGLGMSSFFAFLASSSFIYVDHFGLTATQYSIAFSVNAIGFIGASQFSARLGARYGMGRVISGAVSVYTAVSLVLFALTLAGVDSLAVLMALLFLAFAGLGLVIPATMVLALEEHGPIAGMASALGGTLQFVSGAVVIVIVSFFFDGTALPMVTAIAACALGAFVLAQITLRGPAPVPVLVDDEADLIEEPGPAE